MSIKEPANVQIRVLEALDTARFVEIAGGYTSGERYVVRKEETARRTIFTVDLEELPQPFVKQWEHDKQTLAQYRQVVVEHGLSLGAFKGEALVGIAIAEPRRWNGTLWVWELHVHAGYRGQGIGRRLMEEMALLAVGAGLWMIVCETQNTNVPAIRFYRRMGFELDGLDLSLYSSELDEVALFMKRRL
jgi:ribosomal protein S18 acetylase RimI-like enzyme